MLDGASIYAVIVNSVRLLGERKRCIYRSYKLSLSILKEKREHIYKGEEGKETKKKFEEEYGKVKGDKYYGGTVGKLYRKQHGGKNWNQVNKIRNR